MIFRRISYLFKREDNISKKSVKLVDLGNIIEIYKEKQIIKKEKYKNLVYVQNVLCSINYVSRDFPGGSSV